MRICHASVLPALRRAAHRSTTELLAQLHGSESGFQPYLLTAWSPGLTAQDDISLQLLGAVLDEPLALRTPCTGHLRPGG